MCEFCNERTQLDADSVYELEKIMLDLQSVPMGLTVAPGQKGFKGTNEKHGFAPN